MRRKPRFGWKEAKERSISEIVSEEGVMRKRDILYVLRKLCLMIGGQSEGMQNEWAGMIHPENIILGVDGEIRLDEKEIRLSCAAAYFPPELDREDAAEPAAKVYAMGMLMLFMTTGTEKKMDAAALVGDRLLLFLIERCIAFDPKERFTDIKDLLETLRHETRTEKRILSLSLALLGVFVLTGFLFFAFREGRMRGGAYGESVGYSRGFSEGVEQGLSDAPGFRIRGASFDPDSGNIPGNFTAEGGAIAAWSEDAAFFLQEDKICCLDPYTEEIRVLAQEQGAYDLQYYQGRLYYCTVEKIIRMDPNTGEREEFCDSFAGRFYIFDHGFYLYDSSETGYLYRIDPERGTLTQLNGAMEYRCLNIVGEKLYYIAPNRGESICRCDLDGGNDMLISSKAYESFCIYGEKLYAGTEDGLVCMDLNGGSAERLTISPAYFPNVSEGGIFYISGRGRTLEWMSLDGRISYTVVPSRTLSFNIAGEWIFYRNGEDENRLWRVRAGGSGNARIAR